MARPRGRITVYSDSSLRIARRVSHLDAINMVNSGDGYEWIDEDDPKRGLLVKTQRVPSKPIIATTITMSEVLINAKAVRASDLKIEEVHTKIAHYNDEGMTVGNFCPWPIPQELHFNKCAPEVGAQLEGQIDPAVRLYLLTKLGIADRQF